MLNVGDSAGVVSKSEDAAACRATYPDDGELVHSSVVDARLMIQGSDSDVIRVVILHRPRMELRNIPRTTDRRGTA